MLTVETFQNAETLTAARVTADHDAWLSNETDVMSYAIPIGRVVLASGARRHVDRFTQELDGNLPSAGAHAFAQANLARPRHRPSCGQIGEIETGGQQDDQPDQSQAIDRRPTAGWYTIADLITCVHVHVAEWDQGHGHDQTSRRV